MGQPLADCDFNQAALHPAYPIKRRTSAQRTQASRDRRDPEEASALDSLENSIRRFETSPVRKLRTLASRLKGRHVTDANTRSMPIGFRKLLEGKS
jgi:hypothetical protein